MNQIAVTPRATDEPQQIRAHHRVVKRTGDWTTTNRFDVRASGGVVVLDLLLPQLADGDIEIVLDVDHSMVKLLVPDGAIIDDDDLRRVGRGRVKDWSGTATVNGRRIRLLGELRGSEVRVHRGGVAIVSLLAAGHNAGAVRAIRDAYRAGRLGGSNSRPR